MLKVFKHTFFSKNNSMHNLIILTTSIPLSHGYKYPYNLKTWKSVHLWRCVVVKYGWVMSESLCYITILRTVAWQQQSNYRKRIDWFILFTALKQISSEKLRAYWAGDLKFQIGEINYFILKIIMHQSRQVNWCNKTFTAGNLFPSHSCIGVIWVKPPLAFKPGTRVLQDKRRTTYQMSHPPPPLKINSHLFVMLCKIKLTGMISKGWIHLIFIKRLQFWLNTLKGTMFV